MDIIVFLCAWILNPRAKKQKGPITLEEPLPSPGDFEEKASEKLKGDADIEALHSVADIESGGFQPSIKDISV